MFPRIVSNIKSWLPDNAFTANVLPGEKLNAES